MKIFIVEDDKFYNKLIEHHLRLNPDFEIQTFFNGQDLLDKLSDNPDIISLDFSLPDMTGYDVLSKVRNYDPNIEHPAKLRTLYLTRGFSCIQCSCGY